MADPPSLILAPGFWAEMRDHVERLRPEEACGMLAGKQGSVTAVIPVTNELHSPVRFQMAPREMLTAFQRMDRLGEDLVGIYHSHPSGPAVPSPTDLAEFAYPGTIYLIWSPVGQGDWQVRGFSLDDGSIREVILDPGSQ